MIFTLYSASVILSNEICFFINIINSTHIVRTRLYSLEDVNPNSITYESVIGPDYFVGKVVLHYFGAFT